MDDNALAHIEKLGYEGVLLELAKGDGRLGRPGSVLRQDIEHWLRLKEAERNAASSAIRDAREEAILLIAKEANAIARSQTKAAWRASRYAMYAAAIATIAAIVASKDDIARLLFG
jgi:hypothetical protein